MIMQKNRGKSFNSAFKKRNAFINVKNYDDWFKKTVIRTVVSLILLTMIVIIQMSNFKRPRKILNFVKAKLESDLDLGAYLAVTKKLPGYISTLGEKVVTTMKTEDRADKRFVSPIDGEITTYFDEKIDGTSNVSRGLIFTSDVGEDIYSVDDGVVIDVGSNKSIGNYMIIKHKGELLSVYKYVGTNHMNINQRVERGQTIGVSSGRLLLEIWYRNEPTDPTEYMNISTR